LQPPASGTATPDPKRKRSSGKLVESSSDEEEEEDEEVEMEQEESNGVKKGMRSGDMRSKHERSGNEGDESTETEGEGEGESLGSGESHLSLDIVQSRRLTPRAVDAVSKLREWPATKLRTLRRSELVDLFLALPSTSSSDPDTSSMTKDTLISAITSARKPPSSSLSSNEDESADASPQPRTSHEASPEDEIRPRRARTSNPSTRVNGKTTKTRRSKHPLTPPLTSGEEDNQVQEEDEMDLTDPEEEEENARASAGMTRRASQIEMPPPALPPAPKRQPRRNRSNGEEATVPNVIRFGKRMNEIIQEDEEVPVYTSPVAHRTRGHRPPSNPDPSNSSAPRTIVANGLGSPARPGRAAKQKAVARIKGKARAEDDEEDEEMDMEEEEPESLVISSESDGGDQKGRRKSGQGRRRRSSRTANQVKQVETPPSDADEESGGEEERNEEPVEVELRSHLRAAGKSAKNGKVVRLRKGRKAEEDEPELGESDEEDEDMEADYEEEEEGAEEEEQGEQRVLVRVIVHSLTLAR